MIRNAGGLILFIAGAIVLRLAIFGDFQDYVKAQQGPLLIAMGVLMMILGIIGVVRDVRHPEDYEKGRRRAATLRTEGPFRVEQHVIDEAKRLDHEHEHFRTPGVAWLLCLPVFLVLLVPPPPIGAFSAGRSLPTVPKPASLAFSPLPPGDPVSLAVHDYAQRAVWGDGKTLRGRTVVLTGFVTPKQDGGWYLTRNLITCCAADARSFVVDVRGTDKVYPDNTWVRVTGTFVSSGSHDPNSATPVVNVETVQTIDQPKDPYEE